jgi:hypothetical protein
VLTIAGLWTEWRDRVNDETPTTCTMIITQANSLVGAIHDRMPVLLDQKSTDAWLSGEAGLELLKPAPDDALRMWPVSRRVSKPGNGDDPSLIERVAVHASAEPATLFRLNWSDPPGSAAASQRPVWSALRTQVRHRAKSEKCPTTDSNESMPEGCILNRADFSNWPRKPRRCRHVPATSALAARNSY